MSATLAPVLFCSKSVPELCGRPAASVLLLRIGPADQWSALLRCDQHSPSDDLAILERAYPLAQVAMVALPGRLALAGAEAPAAAAAAVAEGPAFVRLVHWIAGPAIELACGPEADVPGSRASSVIGEVTCPACHAEHRTETELQRMLGGGPIA